jgi:hypothetical protein
MVLSPNACRKTYKLGKIQFIVGSKGLTLCRHDPYGITDLNRRVMIKKNNREVMLRINARKITAEYFDLNKKGLLSWEAYKEHKKTSKNHLVFFVMLSQGTKIVV